VAAIALAAACGTTDDPAPTADPPTTAVAAPSADTAPAARPEDTQMRIQLSTTETQLTAALHDSPTARDFASLLPLTLALQDYASTEKISDLPRQLTTDGAPPGADPTTGDIALYAPWGNLAIYYRDFRYSDGLVLLGRVDASTDQLAALEGNVTFELIDEN
jgi:hypothetical protein